MAKKSAEQLVEEDFPATGNETPLTEVVSDTVVDENSDTNTPPSTAAADLINSINNPTPNPFQAQPNDFSKFRSAIDKFTGQTTPQLSVQDVMAPRNDFEQNAMDDADKYAGAIPAQSFSTYYPSMMNDIQKGSYSGSMIGSNPIYAPSGLYPFGLMDAKQNALKRAADTKVAKMEAFKNKIQGAKPPTTKHKAVQPQITESFYKGLGDWVNKAKKDNPNSDPYQATWSNPDFQKWMQNLNDVAGYEDQAVDHVAEIEKASEKGEYALTPAIIDKIDEFKTGKFGLLTASMNPEDNEKAKRIFNLGPIKDAAKMAKATADGIDPDVFEGSANITPTGLYDILTSTKTTAPNEQRIKDAVDFSWKTLYGGREDLVGLSKEEYYKLVAANMGKKTETTTQTVSTKGDGSDEAFDESAIQEEQSSMLVGRESKDAEGKTSNVQKTVPARYGYTMKQPVKVKLAGSEEMYDLGDSQGGVMKTAPAGVKDVSVQTFTNVPTVRHAGSKKYVPVDDAGLAQAKKDGLDVKWDLYGVVSFQGDEASEFKQKTALVPAEQLKNSVQKTKGKSKTGVDFDKMAVYTEKLNAEERKPAAKPAASKRQKISVAAYNKAKGTNHTKEEITESFGEIYDIID